MGRTIRPFGGTLAEAQGVLAVERATFHESPYTADELRIMLTEGPQRAWVATNGEEVVGFVVGFPISGLSGLSWEIDLLAVDPEWQGRGLATALVHAATSYGSRVARRARAVVATDNHASVRAFTRAGFRPGTERQHLLILRLQGTARRQRPPAIRTQDPTSRVLEHECRVKVREITRPDGLHLTLLQAEQDGRPGGQAELIQVQTLLYRGVWIESLLAPSRIVREALVQHTLALAGARGLDEVGAMVPRHDRPLEDTLLAWGFVSLGEYRWFTATLPPPGPRLPPPGLRSGEAHHIRLQTRKGKSQGTDV